MLGPKNGDLKSISDFNSRWADRVALLILVGLAVDIGAVFVSNRTWYDGLTIVADSLIAIGVWGELWFAKRAREADDSRVAEANALAAKAQLETKGREPQDASGLRPRRITMPSGEPRAEELENAAKYAGTLALIQCVPGDFEAETLAQDISLVLSVCGWKPTILNEPDWLVSPRMITEGVRVVTIEESPFSDGTRKPNPPALSDAGRAADALVAMLERGLGRHEDPPSFAAYWSPEYVEFPFLFHGKSAPPKMPLWFWSG